MKNAIIYGLLYFTHNANLNGILLSIGFRPQSSKLDDEQDL